MKNRTDLAAAICAASFIVVLVVSAYWDHLRLSKKARGDVLPWATAVAGVPAFFLGIFALFAPQYLAMFENLL